jgi:hypothetical protein
MKMPSKRPAPPDRPPSVGADPLPESKCRSPPGVAPWFFAYTLFNQLATRIRQGRREAVGTNEWGTGDENKRLAADGSRAWIDALRPSLPDKGLVETIIFCIACPHAIVRSSRFMRYFWNLAKLFPAALPLVGAWHRPHRRAADGGEGALDGVVRRRVGTTQRRVFRWLISRAMPDICSVARAIWSRQRAITESS